MPLWYFEKYDIHWVQQYDYNRIISVPESSLLRRMRGTRNEVCCDCLAVKLGDQVWGLFCVHSSCTSWARLWARRGGFPCFCVRSRMEDIINWFSVNNVQADKENVKFTSGKRTKSPRFARSARLLYTTNYYPASHQSTHRNPSLTSTVPSSLLCRGLSSIYIGYTRTSPHPSYTRRYRKLREQQNNAVKAEKTARWLSIR